MALPRLLAERLTGLRVAVDVQHLYRDGRHARDRGTLYVLTDGTKLYEADAALLYAQSLVAWLRARGADVLTNQPPILTGPYSARIGAAVAWGADCFLACHLNAGRGGYALLEYPAGSVGERLGRAIGGQLTAQFPEISNSKCEALSPGARGYVCVGGFPDSKPALILEPLFGDHPRHQALLSAPALSMVGWTIGAGVALWWEQGRLAEVRKP